MLHSHCPCVCVPCSAKASQDAEKRLETVLNGLVDIPVIMDNMPQAIRKAARIASP